MNRLPPIWQDMRLADLATLVNAGLGLAAIILGWQGELALAFHLVFLAIVVDGVDGAIARLGGGGGPLGSVIDTLADVVTFVTAPAVLLLMALGTGAWAVAAAGAFLAAGILRLARFQSLPEAPYFFGLSTPGAALLLGCVTLLAGHAAVDPSASSVTDAAFAAAIFAAFVGATAMLMRWPLPKLRGRLGAAAVVLVLANVSLHLAEHAWARYGLYAQLAFLAAYFAAGPAYLKARAGVGAD